MNKSEEYKRGFEDGKREFSESLLKKLTEIKLRKQNQNDKAGARQLQAFIEYLDYFKNKSESSIVAKQSEKKISEE